MNGKKVILIICLITTILLVSGCQDLLEDLHTRYESTPTKIRYNIKYGYNVDCIGIGNYKIEYRFDLPELLKAESYNILYNHNYILESVVNNSFIFWNITGKNSATYELGIQAFIESESSITPDLNGENALTIAEISNLYPNLTYQFIRQQSNLGRILIDHNNIAIKSIAENIVQESKTNNSFLISKLLFVWLKENTKYKMHSQQGDVQPAIVTFNKKTGDCDDLAYLYISLCRSVGIPGRFIRGYLIKNEDGNVSATAHAWVEVFVGGNLGDNGWISVECACCTPSIQADVNQNFGVEDAFHLRLFVDDGSNESLNISLSGIYVQYYEQMDIELDAFAIVENYIEIESKQLVITKDNKRYYE